MFQFYNLTEIFRLMSLSARKRAKEQANTNSEEKNIV